MDNQCGESNTYSNRNQAALDNYDLDREWGYSLLDVPHRVNVNGTLILPIGEGHRWLNRGLGDAVLRGSASPGGPRAARGWLEERHPSRINPAAFTAAPAFTFGNAPRTFSDLRT